MVYALRMPFARAARENLRHFDGEEPGVQTNYLCTKQEQGGGLVPSAPASFPAGEML